MKKTVLTLSNIMSFIAQLVLLFMMFIVTFDVFGRYFFNKPIKGTFELTEVSLALVVFFGLAITHWYKGHVNIDFLVEKLGKKSELIIDGVINMGIAVLVFFVSWNMIIYSQRVSASNTVTGDLKLPVNFFIVMGSLGMFVFGIVALTRAISIIKGVRENGS